MSMMNLLRLKDIRIAALIYALVAIGCTQLPLLNYLGYEFSLVIGVLASYISGTRAIRLIRHASALPSETSTERLQCSVTAFKDALLSNMVLLTIPFAIAAANALFVKNCSLLEGTAFFCLIPAVSVWFATSLGFFCAVHYRFARTIFVLFLAATFAYSAALGYFTPALFSYNFFYGYFPGLTYDEALSLSWTLVAFRLTTVFVGALFFGMATLVVTDSNPYDTTWRKGVQLIKSLAKPRYRVISVGVLALLATLYLSREALGFESTSGYIQLQLGERLETEHFTIYYSASSYAKEELPWIGAEHEFRLQQVLNAFALRFHGKIESYVYPTNETKRRLIGTGTTNIAKPWNGQIHITKQSLDRTLKHELVHVVAAPFGYPVIKASLSTGLVEGLAMAIDWDWGNQTLHQYAAGMKKSGFLPDIKDLMLFTGFAAHSSSVSYVVAGSFCRFLIDQYGMRKMTKLYRSIDYPEAYGRSLEELLGEWLDFLDTIPIDEHDHDAINALFRHPPIFQRVCARVIGERNLLAGRKLSEMDYHAAANLYKQSYEEGRGYDALSGYLASALRGNNFAALTDVFDSVISKDPLQAQYLPLFVNIGIAFWAEGNYAKANELFTRVELADIQENLTEAAIVSRIAMNDTANREALLRYLIASPNDTVRIAMLDSMVHDPLRHWLPTYLKGKVLHRLQRYGETLRVLQQLDPGVPEKTLEAIRLKTLGSALFRMKRFQEAKVCFWVSLNSLATEVARDEINDWIDRCEWILEHGLK